MNHTVENNLTKSCTLFSEERFARAVANASNDQLQPVKVSTRSGTVMYGIAYQSRFGLRHLSLSYFGLYEHPRIIGNYANEVRDLVGNLKSWRMTGFEWNVRYDHAELANELRNCGLSCTQSTTHVLKLTGCHEAVFSGYNATIRNQVRRALREGVVVRQAEDDATVIAYYEIHESLALQKGNYKHLHRIELFKELLKLRDDIVFLVAEIDNTVIAGGWFFRDGDSLFHWHGAMNRAYSKVFPTCSVIDAAIQIGCRDGFSTFNMGGSAGISTLEQFKTSWGADCQTVWQFSWHNPIWRAVRRLRNAMQSNA